MTRARAGVPPTPPRWWILRPVESLSSTIAGSLGLEPSSPNLEPPTIKPGFVTVPTTASAGRKPRDITRFARDFEGWGAMFLGPGGAIQTTTGRLIVPAAAKIGKDFSVLVSADQEPQTATYMRAYVLFSDDHGETWQRGEMIRGPHG